MREAEGVGGLLVEPDDFTWRVARHFNWSGGFEYMIEIEELDGCISYGNTIGDAKHGLYEALHLWIRQYGESALPEIPSGAQLIFLDPPMTVEDFEYINQELKKLN
ncbi:type II toxin-antitoxin system HicB family antitoxin [Halalkalibacterium ligniniphilum]|uniref:type II toxin-antitoxin system HicB family antitoxin n=1 Tax=Halalkalibacterium ligniniphilum TaxID=1134413 RepID=UPI000347A856|nr:type II toxin-antitoxin system HicB family antitoxin [Halalkalibacterium ligniniphilum]